MKTIKIETQIKNILQSFITTNGVKDTDLTIDGNRFFLVAPNRFGYGYIRFISPEFGAWSADFNKAGKLGPPKKREVPLSSGDVPATEEDASESSIPDGRPFMIAPQSSFDNERQIPGRRNALRIESFSPMNRCSLKPINEHGTWALEHRPYHLGYLTSDFGCCFGQACKSCPVAQRRFTNAS